MLEAVGILACEMVHDDERDCDHGCGGAVAVGGGEVGKAAPRLGYTPLACLLARVRFSLWCARLFRLLMLDTL